MAQVEEIVEEKTLVKKSEPRLQSMPRHKIRARKFKNKLVGRTEFW
jgi:hypothetical protein